MKPTPVRYRHCFDAVPSRMPRITIGTRFAIPLILASLALGLPAHATNSTFTKTTTGADNWSTATWTKAGGNTATAYPSTQGDVAIYNTAATSTTTLNGAFTLGSISLGAAATTWTITDGGTGANTLTLDNGTSNATLTGFTGAGTLLTIDANIVLNSNLSIGTGSSQGNLNIGGATVSTHSITGSKDILLSYGAGTVTFNSDISTTGAISDTGANGLGTYNFAGAIGANVSSITQNNGSVSNTMAFQNANGSFAGTVAVNRGIISLNGTAGAFTGAAAFNLTGGTLKLDNVTGNANRIANTQAISLNGGELSLTGNATTDTTEAVGALNLSVTSGSANPSTGASLAFASTVGASTITVTSTTGRVTTLNAASLNRANNATAFINGTNMNQSVTTNVSRIILADGGASLALVGTTTLNNGAAGDASKALTIVPYLYGAGGGLNATFVTYDTTLGLRYLSVNEFTLLAAGSTTAGAPVNATASGNTTITSNAGLTVNSLLIQSAGTLNGSGGALTVNSGAVATYTPNAIIGSGFSKLLLGNGTWNEGVLTAIASSGVTVNTAIDVTGGGGITKTGLGTFILGASNLYSGTTTVNQGTLQIGNGGATGDLGTNTAGIVLNGGNLAFNRTGTLSLANNITGVGGTITHSGVGTTTLSGTNSLGGLTSNVNSVVINVNAGKLVLTGLNTLTGATGGAVGTPSFPGNVGINVGSGASSALSTLSVEGTGALKATNGTFNVGSSAGSRAILNVQDTAQVTAEVTHESPIVLQNQIGSQGSFNIGTNATSSGAVWQSGGTVTVENQFVLGSAGYGFYNLSGGTLAATGAANTYVTGLPALFRIGANANTSGILYQSGGSITGPANLPVSVAIGAGSTGILYLTGGTFSAGAGLALAQVASRGELNVSGGTLSLLGGLSLGGNAASTAILNLDSGVLQTKGITGATASSGAVQVNFNGGTLKAVDATALMAAGNYSARIFSGGATIDTNGQNTTIAQALLAPTGSGVTTIAVATSGSGYVGAPQVIISGTTGATAVANMVSDGAGGYTVGSITITNPGVGLTGAETITLVGGGFATAATTAATIGAGNISANVGGGLRKIGSGSLTLSAVNTYTGATTISAGTLILSSVGTIANSSEVNLGTSASQGTLDLTAKSTGFALGTSQSLTGYGNVLMAAGKTLTVNGALAPGSGPGLISISGNLALGATAFTTIDLVDNTLAAGVGFDQINLTGATPVLTYNGTLTLNLSYTTKLGVYHIFSGFGSESGSFDINYSLAGATGTFDYATGNLTLTGVPEPSAWALMAFGLGTVLFFRRRAIGS